MCFPLGSSLGCSGRTLRLGYTDIAGSPDFKLNSLPYFEEEPGRGSAAKLLTKDEARRNIAKLSQ
jgi:hypothetical protein